MGTCMRRITGLALGAQLALAGLLAPACSAADVPQAEHELIVALPELSGLALRVTPSGEELLAVGDEEAAIFVIPIAAGTPMVAKTRRVALPMLEVAGGSDLEAITVDEQGRIWVLVERGEVLVLTLAGEHATLIWRKPIVFAPGHPLAAAWNEEPNARGEGLALVGKRIFVVKQKAPAALVELFETGESLVAGLSHQLSDMEDANDLARIGDELFVIGAGSARICALPIPGEKGPAGALACTRSWPMPAGLGKGRPQWEGLAFLPDARVLVGVDRKKIDSPNLAVLPALAR